MADRPLRIAVVGTNIGCTLHLRALRSAGFDVTALVGRDVERTRTRAAHFAIPHALGSIEAAIDSDIDAVVIATPPATHHSFAMKAIAAGKHVLCEKPLALDTGEAREMRDAAREAGVIGQLCHPHRWFAHHSAFREAVRNGELGAPLQATFVFDTSLVAEGFGDLPDWWLSPETGGGWLRNYNTHGIDLIRYMIDDFAAVSGIVRSDPARGMTADDGYSVAFLLKNGLQGIMTGSARAHDFFVVSRVIGSTATGMFDRSSAWSIDAAGRHDIQPSAGLLDRLQAGGAPVVAPTTALPILANAYQAIHTTDRGYAEQVGLSRAFRNRILDPFYTHPAAADFGDGVAHMSVIDAIETSMRERRWIDLAEPRSHAANKR